MRNNIPTMSSKYVMMYDTFYFFLAKYLSLADNMISSFLS